MGGVDLTDIIGGAVLTPYVFHILTFHLLCI